MGQSRPLFVYFRPILITIAITQIEISLDGVLGIRTHGRMMVGSDNTMALWRPPMGTMFLNYTFANHLMYKPRCMLFCILEVKTLNDKDTQVFF